MSFLRHRGIYQSDEMKRRARSRLSRNHALLIVLMSSRLVIPGGLLSSSARFRFANRHSFCENRALKSKNYFPSGQKRGMSVKPLSV
jgi:hypothetical protein